MGELQFYKFVSGTPVFYSLFLKIYKIIKKIYKKKKTTRLQEKLIKLFNVSLYPVILLEKLFFYFSRLQ